MSALVKVQSQFTYTFLYKNPIPTLLQVLVLTLLGNLLIQEEE